MFEVGDIVKHKAVFLKSCGWCTNVPRNGVVRATEDAVRFDGSRVVEVEWCDGSRGRILASNIMLANQPDTSGL